MKYSTRFGRRNIGWPVVFPVLCAVISVSAFAHADQSPSKPVTGKPVVENSQNLYSSSGKPSDNEASSYSELAKKLASYKGLVVGVMTDKRFAGKEVPGSLRFEHFKAIWGAIPNVLVLPLDADQIRSYSILFKGKMDILVFPYGDIYPMEAYGIFSGQSFDYFLRRGGAVLTTGGIPFAGQASPFGEVKDTSTPEKLTDVFDKWISKFGIKYYQCRIAPTREYCDRDLLPALPSPATWTPSSTGVVVVNSAHEPVPKPSAGQCLSRTHACPDGDPIDMWLGPLGPATLH